MRTERRPPANRRMERPSRRRSPRSTPTGPVGGTAGGTRRGTGALPRCPPGAERGLAGPRRAMTPVAQVPFTDLGAMAREVRRDVDAAWAALLADSDFIEGAAVERFEQEWA